MSALGDIADEVNGLMTNYGLTQSRSAWLRAGVDDSELTWQVDSVDSLSEGVAEIEDELVYIRNYDESGPGIVIAPDGRGYLNSTPAAHDVNTRIRIEPLFTRQAIKTAVNNAITRCFPTIWGTGTSTLTFNASVATYELPATAQKILSVSTQTWGSSGMWERVNVYSFDGHADTTEYPNGKTITLGGGLYPGREFQVTYSKTPEQLDPADSDFTDTGLQQSARRAVVMGACADLMRFTDPFRIMTSSAQADEFDTKKPYGIATKLANDFENQFQAELAAEAVRLRQLHPARIHRKLN